MYGWDVATNHNKRSNKQLSLHRRVNSTEHTQKNKFIYMHVHKHSSFINRNQTCAQTYKILPSLTYEVFLPSFLRESISGPTQLG